MESPNARGRKSVHFEPSAQGHEDVTTAPSASPHQNAEERAGQATSAQNAAAAAVASAVSAAPFQLTKDDVYTAFQFFDAAGTGVLQMANLKPRLSPFFPDMTMKEYRFLLEEPSVGGATGSAASDDGAAHGLTAAQLWDLIDTFQRLYLNPAMQEQRQAALSAAASANGSSSTTPMRGGARATTNAASAAASSHGGTSPVRSPRRATGKQSPRHANAAASSPNAVGSSGLRSANQAIPPSIMFDVLHGYDPVREAFDVYDPAHTGAVDVAVLGQVMARIGFGQLSHDELALLVRTADFDRDGKITLPDFRRLVNMKERFKKKKKPQQQSGN